MDDDDAMMLAAYAFLNRKRVKKRDRSVWVKPYLAQRATMSILAMEHFVLNFKQKLVF